MSNANQTSRTRFVGVRIPLDVIEFLESAQLTSGDSRSTLIVAALRQAWELPEVVKVQKGGNGV